MKLYPISAFSDNYIWCLVHQNRALVVDPGDADVVLSWLQTHNLQLDTIFITHHHGDHTGGVAELHRQTQARVYAPATEWLNVHINCTRVSAQLISIIQIFDLSWQILDIPGHTKGHVAYWCSDVPLTNGSSSILFSGDTLFSGGCGRLFEGTAADMYASLQQLSALPDGTLVCCAHEYTLSNLRFAMHLEPHNTALYEYWVECEQKRNREIPTLPSTLRKEKQVNPFLRVSESSIKSAVKQYQTPVSDHPQDVLGVLRHWKNHFS